MPGVMRESALLEASPAPRVKQAPPQAKAGATAGSAGAKTHHHNPHHNSSPQHQKSSQHKSKQPSTPTIPHQQTGSQPRPSSSAVKEAVQQKILQHSNHHFQNQTPQPRQKNSAGSHQVSLQRGSSQQKSPSTNSSENQHQQVSSSQSQKSSEKGSGSTSQKKGLLDDDDEEQWDVGVDVGNLIIDLEADIAQADRTGRMNNTTLHNHHHNNTITTTTATPNHNQTPTTPASASTQQSNKQVEGEDKHSLKMKIKRTKPTTKAGEAKHEIVKPVNPHPNPQHPSNSQGPNTTAMQHHAPHGSIQHQHPGTPQQTVPRSVPHASGVQGGPPGVNPGGPSTHHHNGAHPAGGAPVEVNGRTPIVANRPGQNQHQQQRQQHKKDKRRHEVNGTSSPGPIQTNAASPRGPMTPQGGVQQPHSPAGPVARVGGPTAGNLPSGAVGSPLSSGSSGMVVGPSTPSGGTGTVQYQNVSNKQEPPSKRTKVGEDGPGRRDMCVGTSVAVNTDPDHLGPCEPGTSVTLEGIVWHETEGGVLVVNVTWRGKTYVGTLLDCTRHDWAPPRFCDSPSSDIESRTPKGRGKRGAAGRAITNQVGAPPTPDIMVTETRSGKQLRGVGAVGKGGRGRGGANTPTFNLPPSPVKSEPGGIKRKGQGNEIVDPKNFKRARALSRDSNGTISPTMDISPDSPNLIECPEPNCCKKYKHINGLKYHQAHAHNTDEDMDGDDIEITDDTRTGESPKPVVEAPVDNKDLVKPSVLRYTGAQGNNQVLANNGTQVKQEPGANGASQTSVIQGQARYAGQPGQQQMYMYHGTGQVVSPGRQPGPGQISSPVNPALRPQGQVRPEMMMRMGPGGSPGGAIRPAGPPQGTQLSSLPGTMPTIVKGKLTNAEGDKGKNLVNGIGGKDPKEEDISREDTRSPAYSDISDANDTAPVMDGDSDNKDSGDKKPDMGALGASAGPYGAYPHPMFYGAPYSQQPPFLGYPNPLPAPPPGTGKEGDSKDKITSDKDVKNLVTGPNSDYLKLPPQYLYYLPYQGYPDPYLRDSLAYKEQLEKAKAEGKEIPVMREGDKISADLTRGVPGLPPNQGPPQGMPLGLHSPGAPSNAKIEPGKDKENHKLIKDVNDLKGQIPADQKRIYEQQMAALAAAAYRYPPMAYDQRLPLQPTGGALESGKPGDKIMTGPPRPSPPVAPLSSPRGVTSTPPGPGSKDGIEKKDGKVDGAKPTMETTGPPPPPTSSYYASAFPPYALYDYRAALPGMALPGMVPGMVPPGYLAAHPGLRLPGGGGPPGGAPEDLSRVQQPPFPNHKIHELGESQRLRSPAPSVSPALSAGTPGKVTSPSTTPKDHPPSNPSSLPPSSVPSPSPGGDRRTPPVGVRPPPHHLLDGFYPHPHMQPPFQNFAVMGPGAAVMGASGAVSVPSGLAPPPQAK